MERDAEREWWWSKEKREQIYGYEKIGWRMNNNGKKACGTPFHVNEKKIRKLLEEAYQEKEPFKGRKWLPWELCVMEERSRKYRRSPARVVLGLPMTRLIEIVAMDLGEFSRRKDIPCVDR